MEITVENVTPAKAESWINKNRSNRKLRDGVVEKYAKDMLDGAWTDCPAPIAFFTDGDLADGQHRLWAIVESGTTQRFPVARGLTRDAGLNIDTGLGRTLVDNARISGADKDLSNRLLAATRAINEGGRPEGTQTAAHRLAVVDKHREAAQFAISSIASVRLLCNAVMLGAVGRAWYHEKDRDRLRAFGEVLAKGYMQSEGDSAAVTIRNYLILKGAIASSAANWRDTFLKVQNAISYFMRGKGLTVIKSVKDEPYALTKSQIILTTSMPRTKRAARPADASSRRRSTSAGL